MNPHLSKLTQNYSIPVNQIDLHKFQKGIVETQKRNQLYRAMPVGSYNKDSTGTLDISTKTTFTKLFHFGKSFNGFTESLKKNVKRLGGFIGEVSNPHLPLYHLKLKKSLNVLIWKLTHSRFTIQL